MKKKRENRERPPDELKPKLGWFSIFGNLFMFFGFCGMLAWIIYFILWTQFETLRWCKKSVQSKTKCNERVSWWGGSGEHRAILRFTTIMKMRNFVDVGYFGLKNDEIIWKIEDSSWLAVFSLLLMFMLFMVRTWIIFIWKSNTRKTIKKLLGVESSMSFDCFLALDSCRFFEFRVDERRT